MLPTLSNALGQVITFQNQIYRRRFEISVAKVAKTFGDLPCWPKLLASFATLIADTLKRPRYNKHAEISTRHQIMRRIKDVWIRFALNKLWWHFARFAKVVEGLDPAAENLQPMTVANANLRVCVLKGEHTTLVWCRDAENSWQQELANGVPPRELKDVTIDMSPAGGLAGATARVYDPWKDVWTDIQPDGDAITLPPFKRSIVVKIVR